MSDSWVKPAKLALVRRIRGLALAADIKMAKPGRKVGWEAWKLVSLGTG